MKAGVKANSALIDLANDFSKKRQAKSLAANKQEESIKEARRVIINVLNPKLAYKPTIKKALH